MLKNRKKPRKLPKSSVSQLKKKADVYWSRATRYRFMNDDGSVGCVTCGLKMDFKKAQCGHFMSRRYNATRFSEENTAPQCFGCNVMQQGQQYKFSVWIDSFYGDGTAKRLAQQAQEYHKLTVEELEGIIADAKSQVEFYETKTL